MKANKKIAKGIYIVSNPIKSCNKCINIIINNYFILVSGGILLPTILWFNLSLSWKTLSKLIFPAEQRTIEKIVWEKAYICHKTRNSWIMKSQTSDVQIFLLMSRHHSISTCSDSTKSQAWPISQPDCHVWILRNWVLYDVQFTYPTLISWLSVQAESQQTLDLPLHKKPKTFEK